MQELLRELNARADILYAQPNYIARSLQVTPNDEFYSFQWHYPAINMPQAWSITTGSSSVIVAVVDTGILPGHPDFAGRLLPGYDFVSNPNNSGDGTGRDPDPTDLSAGHHGSHVAGTIGATTNNEIGVAGVDWAARIVPVRVLGANGSGSFVDILEGTMWGAGLPVSGVPNNPNPANILNLSLGGVGPCDPFEQDVFDQIAATGAIVVVAAGNDNQNAGGYSPASCRGVITVGATDFRGHRAPYSNHGARIDVMAPGGDVTVDRNNDGYADGVLSLGADNAAGQYIFTFKDGTSMAAPHVAGVISLMMSIKPDLTTSEALTALQSTARPLSTSECQRPNATDCGAGLIDAAAALQAVQQGPTPPPPTGELTFNPNPLDFGGSDSQLSLTLTNTTNSTLNWQITAYEIPANNSGPVEAGVLFPPPGAPTQGTLTAGQSTTTQVGLDRSKASVAGGYQFDLVFVVNGNEQRLPVQFTLVADTSPSLNGPMIVAAFIETSSGELGESGFQFSEGAIEAYEFDVLSGNNLVVAWSDENNNLVIDEGDYLGFYPNIVSVSPGQRVTGIDFAVERVVSVEQLGLSEEDWVALQRALEHLVQEGVR